MTIQYVCESDLGRLTFRVNEFLRKGWQLHGSIVVDSNSNGTQYIQAVILGELQ